MTDAEDGRWYQRRTVWVLGAVLVLLAGVAVGFLVNGDGDGDAPTSTTATATVPTTPSTTTVPPTPPTTAVTTTVPPADENACAAGDQVACDRLTTPQLQAQCDGGNEDACQVLLARQGDAGDVEDD